ncbi:MAG: MaoC family dehydratase [Anaerovoracaceae bacterium]|jgi:3-hydroxybutyryl-CoA dehydratase
MAEKEKAVSIPMRVGDAGHFAKTVSEADVYLFAGISGDTNRAHLNEEYMKRTPAGHRVAHGALTLSIASAAQTDLLNRRMDELEAAGLSYLSVGYDHVRFLAPVYFGDTLTATCEVVEIDAARSRTIEELTAFNQDGVQVLAARHIHHYGRKE